MNLLCLPRKSVSSWEDKSKSPYFQPSLLATKQTSFQLIKAYRNLSLMFARRQISTSFIAGDRVQMYTGKKKGIDKKAGWDDLFKRFFSGPCPAHPLLPPHRPINHHLSTSCTCSLCLLLHCRNSTEFIFIFVQGDKWNDAEPANES